MLSLIAIRISTCWSRNAGRSVCSKDSSAADDEVMGTSDCIALETLNLMPPTPLTQERRPSCANPH